LKTASATTWGILAATVACLAIVPNLNAGEKSRVEIFAPGVISGPAGDVAPTFSPDCRTVYFTVGNSADAIVLVSQFDGKAWMRPRIADFSGRWQDLESTLSPDGSYMIFASNRPAQDSGKPLRADYEGRNQDGGNLWRVDHRGPGWSSPVRLPDTINSSSAVFTPSIARDNTLYFMKASPVTGRFQIYRSQFQGGTYQAPRQLPFSDEQWDNVDPTVAPDESFLVFASNRPPTAPSDLDLFVVFRQNGEWGVPEHLEQPINGPTREIEPRLAPDGHTLFFSSRRVLTGEFPRTQAEGLRTLERLEKWDNGANNIWRADLSQWFDTTNHRSMGGNAGCRVP
jgi:Tol biopolymer transport system component